MTNCRNCGAAFNRWDEDCGYCGTMHVEFPKNQETVYIRNQTIATPFKIEDGKHYVFESCRFAASAMGMFTK